MPYDGLVYECIDGPMDVYCGMTGYEPGKSDLSGVWKLLGSCVGILQPTGSPIHESLVDYGGCPNAWEREDYNYKYQEVSNYCVSLPYQELAGLANSYSVCFDRVTL